VLGLSVRSWHERVGAGSTPDAVARGVVLGNPKLHVARRSAVEAVTTGAQKAGATTLRDIADALNARGVATARGGQWHAKSVSNILERA
jgi:hypothetical protein